METEIWPNLLHGARTKAACPMVLANARLSEKQRCAKGQRLAALLHGAAARFDTLCWRRPRPTRAWLRAGRADVQVMGNLKFDMARRGRAAGPRPQAWRQALGAAGAADAASHARR